MEATTSKTKQFINFISELTRKDLVFIIIILLLLFIIGFMSWSSDKAQMEKVPASIDVKIPAVKGDSDTVYMPVPVVRDTTIYKENPYNKALASKFADSQDSIEKLQMYIRAISENDYKVTFKDSTQAVTVSTKVQGKLLEQAINYDIFERTVRVDTVFDVEVEHKRKLYALVELGAPLQIKQNAFIGKATFIFKNKKDQLFSTSIDTDAHIWIGAGIKF